MRKAFNTSIDEKIQNNFKAECAKQGQQMNKVLEMFMESFIDGDFTIKMMYRESREEKGK